MEGKLINADDLLALYNMSAIEEMGEYGQGGMAIIDDIKNAPSVDAEPIRHGYWYFLQYDVNPKIGNWHCSVCNNIPKSLEKEKYCPNCGAKMDETVSE